MKFLPGPYAVGADATDLMGAPEGGRFVALDAPAANHYAFAVVVVQLSDAEPDSESTKRLQGTAQLLATAPDLLAMLQEIYAAEFGYGGWPSGPDIRDLILKAGGEA